MIKEDFDDYIRTSFVETFISCSPMHIGSISSSILLSNFPFIASYENLRFYLQFLLQIIPFLYTIFEKPFNNNLHISIPLLLTTFIYIILSILHFKQKLNNCIDTTPSQNNEDLSLEHMFLRRKFKPPLALTTRTRSLTMFRGSLYISSGMLMISQEMETFRMKFSKSETFGTGIMDVGIGSFVLLMGVVGPSRQWINYKHIFDKQKTIYHIIYSSIVMFIVGIIYHYIEIALSISHHDSEYGRDMNIFHIFAVIKLSGNLIELLCFNTIPFWFVSLFVAIAYEIYLYMSDIKNEIFQNINRKKAPDLSYLEANKEALLSIIGLHTLYFMGAFIGQTFYKSRSNCPGINKKPTHQMAVFLIIASILTGLVYIINENLDILDVASRKLCNLSYDIWVLTFFLYNIGIALFIEINEDKVYQRSLPPKSYSETIDFCGLVYFGISSMSKIGLTLFTRKYQLDAWTDIPVTLCLTLLCGLISIKIQRFLQNKIHFKLI